MNTTPTDDTQPITPPPAPNPIPDDLTAAQREAWQDRPMHPYDTEDGRTFYFPARSPECTLEIGSDQGGSSVTEIKAQRRHYSHGYQNYVCTKCNRTSSQGVTGSGNTPTFMACTHAPVEGGGLSCGIGTTEQPLGDTRAEWTPANAKLIEFYGKYDPAMWRHVTQGGLAYSPAHFVICSACHAGIERGQEQHWDNTPICIQCLTESQGDEPRIKQRRGFRSGKPVVPGRNEPCHCGAELNGKPRKFKLCHGI